MFGSRYLGEESLKRDEILGSYEALINPTTQTFGQGGSGAHWVAKIL